MLKYSLLGVALVAIMVLIHAAGTSWWLNHLGRRFDALDKLGRSAGSFRILMATVVILTVLHIVQIIVWALAYMLLLPADVFGTFEEATYFSFVTYTTLGYGDVTLTNVWRILSGIQALNGILLIGWSTALLFAIVSRVWGGTSRVSAGNQE